MLRRPRSNKVSTDDLRELVTRSGLTQNKFAVAIGLSASAMSELMTGRRLPGLVVMNAARFVMLRLGHAVEIKPIDDAMFLRLPKRGK